MEFNSELRKVGLGALGRARAPELQAEHGGNEEGSHIAREGRGDIWLVVASPDHGDQVRREVWSGPRAHHEPLSILWCATWRSWPRVPIHCRRRHCRTEFGEMHARSFEANILGTISRTSSKVKETLCRFPKWRTSMLRETLSGIREPDHKKRQLKVASGCRFALDVIVHHHPAGQLPLADQEPVICDLGPAAWC